MLVVFDSSDQTSGGLTISTPNFDGVATHAFDGVALQSFNGFALPAQIDGFASHTRTPGKSALILEPDRVDSVRGRGQIR